MGREAICVLLAGEKGGGERGTGRGRGEERRRELDFSPVEDPDRVLCGKRN